MLSFSAQMVIGTFHTIQLMCLLTLANIELPVNAYILAKSILTIVTFDMVDPEIIHNFFRLDFSLDEKMTYDSIITPHFKDFDFKTFNPV